MTLTCFYRVNLQRWNTLILCCTCRGAATQVPAITPVGVTLCMLLNGWWRLSPDWYTLWQCPTCFRREKEPRPEISDDFFATMKPGGYSEVKVRGIALSRGRRRKHGSEDAKKGELGQLQAWT